MFHRQTVIYNPKWMNKTLLKIISIVFSFLSLVLLYDLIQPKKHSTTAIKKEIELSKNLSEKFETDFDYAYVLILTLKTDEINFNENKFDIELKKNGIGFVDTLKLIPNDINNYEVRQYFTAKSGDEFELVIKELDKSLIGVKANLNVDVTGAGPSIGLAFERYFRPYFWILLGLLILITILTGIYGFKKITSR